MPNAAAARQSTIWLRSLGAAWLSRSDNPLLRIHELARKRRALAVPLRRRQAAVLLRTALVLLAGWATFDGVSGSYNYNSSSYGAELAGLAAAAASLICLWLLPALFGALRSAACLLSLPGKLRLDLQVDEALAASRLGNAELLLGLLWPLFRPLLLPLAATAVLIAGMLVNLAFTQGWSGNYGYFAPHQLVWPLLQDNPRVQLAAVLDFALHPGYQALLLSPLSVLSIFSSGALATLLLILLHFITGRGLRMDVHSAVLAALYTLGTMGFGLLSLLFSEPLRYLYGQSAQRGGSGTGISELEPAPFLLLALLLALTLVLLAGASRRWGGLPLGYGLPLLFIGSFAWLIWVTANGSYFSGDEQLHLWIDWLLSWSMLAPTSALAVPHPVCVGTGAVLILGEPRGEHFRWLYLLPAQVLFCIALLRHALACIQHQRRPQGS